MKFFHDEAIVLRKRPMKEKDEMLTVLTRLHGKRIFMVPGSRDPRSKKAGVLELCNTIEFQVKDTVKGFPFLNSVKLLTSRGLGIVEEDQSLDEFYRALHMLKITDQFVQEDQNAENIFHRLETALDHVSEPLSLVWYWTWLMNELGFLPDFKTCVFCHLKPDKSDELSFCTEHRGFAHSKCLSMNTETVQKEALSMGYDSGKNVFATVSFDTVKVMAYLQCHDWEEVSKLKVSRVMGETIRALLETCEIS